MGSLCGLLTMLSSRTFEISKGTPGGYPNSLDLHLNLTSTTGNTVRNMNCIGSMSTLHSSCTWLVSNHKHKRHTTNFDDLSLYGFSRLIWGSSVHLKKPKRSPVDPTNLFYKSYHMSCLQLEFLGSPTSSCCYQMLLTNRDPFFHQFYYISPFLFWLTNAIQVF